MEQYENIQKQNFLVEYHICLIFFDSWTFGTGQPLLGATTPTDGVVPLVTVATFPDPREA